MKMVLIDKLPDLSRRHARQVTQQWFESLNTNTKTTSFNKVPKKVNPDYAASFHECPGEILQAQDIFLPFPPG
ncbi:MAG: hypothetical protein PHU23_18950 [Dehalococcoidales bacterium]|nr:hypothetical protein [Dehalococcoidales bacterium]